MVYQKASTSHLVTSALLAVVSIMIAIIGWFCVDKLGTIDSRGTKLFSAVGDIKSSFNEYKVTSEGRFTKIETQLGDIKDKVQ